MNKILLFGISLLTVLCVSCSNGPKDEPKLNEDQFVNMLIDIHIADGTLTSQNIYRAGNNYRPSYYYNSIYEKYDLTPAEFDSCVFFYSKNTEQLTQIYDRVIDSLNRLETKLRIELKEAKLAQDTVNLWKKKLHWRVPADGRPKFDFSIPVKEKGIYTVRASIKLFKEDQTYNPKVEAYFWKSDTASGPQKVHFDPAIIKKTMKFDTYEIQLEYPDSTYTELRGNLFAGENDLSQFTQRYEIKDIMIFNPQIKPDTTELDFEELDKKLDRRLR